MSFIPAFEIGLWNAWIFMIWTIVTPILLSLIIKEKGVSKILRTSVPMKHEKTLNIISMGAVIIGFLYSIFLPLKINKIWFYIGSLIFLFGFIFDLSILITLRSAKPDKPFTNGPYKYSRHPGYFALFMIMISISIMSLSWVFLLIAIICGIHLIIVAPVEEQYCLEKYGTDYKDYIERTPRWIGIPKSYEN
ncbi:methyltransferase family protein [Thermoplasmatota archaeon]